MDEEEIEDEVVEVDQEVETEDVVEEGKLNNFFSLSRE